MAAPHNWEKTAPPEEQARRSSRAGRTQITGSRYLPCKKSMTGGNVMRIAAANMAKEITLIRARLTSRMTQSRERSSQASSQMRIATPVTPDKGPVGFQKFRAADTVREASPASANNASAKEPIPAASTAAAPRPLVILLPISLMGFRFQDNQFIAAANRGVLVQHDAEQARHGGGNERDGGKAQHGVAKTAKAGKLRTVFDK